MKSKRTDYASSSEWLADVKKDGFWLSELQALQNSTPDDLSNMRERAMRKLGKTLTFEFWDSKHDVERVVEAVWAEEDLSLPKLMIQTIGMLMLEWIEQHEKTNMQYPEIIKLLKPIFYGDEVKAKAFLDSIQGMKPTHITAMVNQLVDEGIISELSRKHDLYKVLYDTGIYTRSESNWNMQVN